MLLHTQIEAGRTRDVQASAGAIIPAGQRQRTPPCNDELIRLSGALLLARLPFPRPFRAAAIKSELHFDPSKSPDPEFAPGPHPFSIYPSLAINYHPQASTRLRLITTGCLRNHSHANQPRILFRVAFTRFPTTLMIRLLFGLFATELFALVCA